MVKGISRQVIVVHSPNPKLFEQAIFILKDEAVREGITDEVLMQEAEQSIRRGKAPKKRHPFLYAGVWTSVGALLTGAVWLIMTLL